MSQQETTNRNTEDAPCQIVEVANQLASQANVTSRIPPDYDPSELWYEQIRAEIRHEFTNYEQLLHELPICADHWDAGGECVWDAESGLECPLVEGGSALQDLRRLATTGPVLALPIPLAGP